MSLTASLNNALSGLKASNIGIAVTSDNIANAMTDGFHKREVALTSRLGGGVSVTSIDRYVNAALAGQMYQINASSASHETSKAMLNTVYTALGLHSDQGDLHEHLADLKSLLLDAPPHTGAAQRIADITAKAGQFANMLSHAQDVLNSEKHAAVSSIKEQIALVNSHISKIAKWNTEIQTASDQTRNHIADRRDALLDELSGILPITVRYGDKNDVKIYTANGMPLLDRGPKPLYFDGTDIYQKTTNGQTPIIRTTDFGNGVMGSGRLSAAFKLALQDIPQLERVFDNLVSDAINLPDIFNATSNNLATSFGVFAQSASGLSIEPALVMGTRLADGTQIDAGSITLKPASGLAQAITSFSELEARSLDIVTSIAGRLKAAEVELENHSLQKQALEGVFSETGVKLEDQAFNLVTLQNAYEANARVLKIVDELHKTLVRL